MKKTIISLITLLSICLSLVSPIYAESLSLNKTSLTLNKGQSETLVIQDLPVEEDCLWESSNPSIASVENGVVKALGVGSTNITVTVQEQSAICHVTVKSPITSVQLNKTSLSIYKGKTYALKATINPSDTTDSKTLKWTSSNTKVATINNKGVVTAKNYGKTTITVITSTYKKATCQVTVPYKITYHLNGGTNNKANPSNYYGKKITLKNPSRKGYTFAGWYYDSKYKKKVTSFSSGNKTVYAKWKKVTVGKGNTPQLTVNQNKLTISYKSVSKAKGYQIQYATNSKMTNATTKTLTTTKATYELSNNKLYYVRVRAYQLDSTGNKVYGSFSRIQSKRTGYKQIRPQKGTYVNNVNASMYDPSYTLNISKISSSSISFTICKVGSHMSYIYDTNTITIGINNNNTTKTFKWTDSYDNSGTGTMTFLSPHQICLNIKQTKSGPWGNSSTLTCQNLKLTYVKEWY